MYLIKFFKLFWLFLLLFPISCARTDLDPMVFKGSKIIKQKSLKISKVSLKSSFLQKILIKKGDTLFSISRKNGVSLRKLIELNRLKAPYLIKKGEFLKIPGVHFHIAQMNETIYGIARAHGVNMRSLVKINKVKPPYKIKRGDRLQIPYSEAVNNNSPTRSNKLKKKIKRNKVEIKKNFTFRKNYTKKDLKAPSQNLILPSSTPSLSKNYNPKFLWPVKGKVIVSFGPRKNGFFNDGINIAAKHGTVVRATGKGTVAYVGNQLQGFGNLVLIRHSGGWMSAYAHSSIVFVSRGSSVQRGQMIAKVGQTGNVGRPQLHFELRRGDRAVDPRKFLNQHSNLSINNLLAFQVVLPDPV